MIRQTFQHLPNVGPWREKDLWAKGIHSWQDFLTAPGVKISSAADEESRRILSRSEEALVRGDLETLARLFPPRIHWRLYAAFADEALFFDIEAGGDSGRPTVVSVFDWTGFQVFIEGRNLQELVGAMASHRLWVSFNGSVFDLPVLRLRFGEFPLPAVHLDLRFLCQLAGLRGGLKDVEEQLGIPRPPHLRGLSGMNAVRWWESFQRGDDPNALKYLVEYNLYDTIQLRSVMDLVFNQSVEALGFASFRKDVFDRGDVLYDVSKLLLAL